jgi:hypothetical protein
MSQKRKRVAARLTPRMAATAVRVWIAGAVMIAVVP